MKNFIFVIILIQFYECIALEHCTRDICIPSYYDKLVPPILNDTNVINVWFNDIKILKIDDYDCAITLKIELGLYWIEPRLKAPSSVPYMIPLDQSFLNLLWIPDIYIDDVKKITKHHLNSDYEAIGEILYHFCPQKSKLFKSNCFDQLHKCFIKTPKI